MTDVIATLVACVMLVIIAGVMWQKDWWGKIIATICGASAVMGIFRSFWVFLVAVIIICIAAAVISEKK